MLIFLIVIYVFQVKLIESFIINNNSCKNFNNTFNVNYKIIKNDTKNNNFYYNKRNKNEINVFFDECDDNEFFNHTLYQDDEDSDSKNRRNRKSRDKNSDIDDTRRNRHRHYSYDDKINITRSISKNIKSRYKYQSPPKEKHKNNIDINSNKLENVKNIGAYKFVKSLKICGGSVRGRKLCMPPVHIRPMMSRVKGSLFNHLMYLNLFAIDKELSVIDLYCGSGSLGLESLSRGANKCTFVDIAPQCLQAVKLNINKCGFQNRCHLIQSDCIELLSSPYLFNLNEKFDLMFVCPPYQEVVYSDILDAISNCNILNDDAIVLVEYPREISYLPHTINDKLFGIKNKRFGRTIVASYVYNPTDKYSELINKSKYLFTNCNNARQLKKKLRSEVDADVLIC